MSSRSRRRHLETAVAAFTRPDETPVCAPAEEAQRRQALLAEVQPLFDRARRAVDEAQAQADADLAAAAADHPALAVRGEDLMRADWLQRYAQAVHGRAEPDELVTLAGAILHREDQVAALAVLPVARAALRQATRRGVPARLPLADAVTRLDALVERDVLARQEAARELRGQALALSSAVTRLQADLDGTAAHDRAERRHRVRF